MYGSHLGEYERAFESSEIFYKNNYSEQKIKFAASKYFTNMVILVEYIEGLL